MNWRSKRAVLLVIGGVCLLMFIGGMAAAWNNRHHHICPNGQPPLEQHQGLLGQTVYQCSDGRIVTTS